MRTDFLVRGYSRPMMVFLNKHKNCNGFQPGQEIRARKKAGIGYTYYCCYDCGERIRRKNEIERLGK